MEVINLKDEGKFENVMLDLIEKNCEQVLERKPKVVIGVSGGKTPVELYKLMNKEFKYFERCVFVLVDERVVPRESEFSNYKMIKSTLFEGKDEGRFVYFETERKEGEMCEQFEKRFMELADGELDLLILGVGVDGHFASVFPESDAIDSEKVCCLTETLEFDVKERVTITRKWLEKAEFVYLTVVGETKRALADKIEGIREKDFTFPASYLVENKGLVLVRG